MKDIFDILFDQGNIWGILSIAAFFAGIVILQHFHEKGLKNARTGQYVIGILFLIYMVIIYTKI